MLHLYGVFLAQLTSWANGTNGQNQSLCLYVSHCLSVC